MLRYRWATQDDNEKILKLIKATPQQGLVKLNFEREPDFFAGSYVTSQKPHIAIAEDKETDSIEAISSVGFREVFVNGEPRDVSYGNDLRLSEKSRGGRTLLKLYRQSRCLVDDSDFGQTVILDGNDLSTNTIAAGRAGMPNYYPYGKLTTYIISTVFDFASNNPDVSIRRANKSDIPAMQALFDAEAPSKQFYPRYDFSLIGTDPYYRDIAIEDYFLAEREGELVGITGSWKQKKFKQTIIIDYPKWMNLIRPFYNLFCKCFGGFVLPDRGATVDYLNLHTVVTKNNDASVLTMLLKSIRQSYCGQERTLILGLCDSDPLQNALRGFIFRTMKSQHYLVSHGPDCRSSLDSSRPLYLEASRL
jgi:hypothetical protein